MTPGKMFASASAMTISGYRFREADMGFFVQHHQGITCEVYHYAAGHFIRAVGLQFCNLEKLENTARNVLDEYIGTYGLERITKRFDAMVTLND